MKILTLYNTIGLILVTERSEKYRNDSNSNQIKYRIVKSFCKNFNTFLNLSVIELLKKLEAIF